MGLLLTVVVTAASTQDRDGAVPLLARLRKRFSTIALTWYEWLAPIGWRRRREMRVRRGMCT